MKATKDCQPAPTATPAQFEELVRILHIWNSW